MKSTGDIFHKVLGLLVIAVHFYLLLHIEQIFPRMIEGLNARSLGRAHPQIGVLFSLICPFFSAICFIFPKTLNKRFSPKTKILKESVLTPGCWLILGYFLLFLSIALLALFRDPSIL